MEEKKNNQGTMLVYRGQCLCMYTFCQLLKLRILTCSVHPSRNPKAAVELDKKVRLLTLTFSAFETILVELFFFFRHTHTQTYW